MFSFIQPDFKPRDCVHPYCSLVGQVAGMNSSCPLTVAPTRFAHLGLFPGPGAGSRPFRHEKSQFLDKLGIFYCFNSPLT